MGHAKKAKQPGGAEMHAHKCNQIAAECNSATPFISAEKYASSVLLCVLRSKASSHLPKGHEGTKSNACVLGSLRGCPRATPLNALERTRSNIGILLD